MNVSAIEILARTSEGQKSGPLGFAVILVLCIACYFLFKSMSKHLKKVREEFPADEPQPVRPPVQATPASSPPVTEESSPPTA
jgi:hypothetical protein